MAFDPASSNYYKRLGVDASASTDTIRRAFRRIARQTHPDRNPDDPRAADRFRRVREAYVVLSDDATRARYDANRARASRRSAASEASAITATSVSETGCVTYYLPRVAIGLLACVAFFLLEAFDVWQSDDMQAVALWVTGASLVTGALSVLVFWLFPDTSDDYAVRFGADGVRVWSESRMVAQVPWAAVRAVDATPARGIVRLAVTPPVADRVVPTPPVLTVDRSGADGPVLRLYLAGTDVNLPRLLRFLQTVPTGSVSSS